MDNEEVIYKEKIIPYFFRSYFWVVLLIPMLFILLIGDLFSIAILFYSPPVEFFLFPLLGLVGTFFATFLLKHYVDKNREMERIKLIRDNKLLLRFSKVSFPLNGINEICYNNEMRFIVVDVKDKKYCIMSLSDSTIYGLKNILKEYGVKVSRVYNGIKAWDDLIFL